MAPLAALIPLAMSAMSAAGAAVGGTVGTIASVASAIGGIASTVGTVMSAVQQSKEAGMAARESREEAKSVQFQTEIAQRQERQKNAIILARQRAIGAGTGLAPESGSLVDTELASAFQGEMNALNIGYTGALKRYSILKEQDYYRRARGAAISKGIIGGIAQGAQTASLLGSFMPKAPSAPSTGLGGSTAWNIPAMSQRYSLS